MLREILRHTGCSVDHDVAAVQTEMRKLTRTQSCSTNTTELQQCIQEVGWTGNSCLFVWFFFLQNISLSLPQQGTCHDWNSNMTWTCNDKLAPFRTQNWTWWQVFCIWTLPARHHAVFRNEELLETGALKNTHTKKSSYWCCSLYLVMYYNVIIFPS